MDIAQKLGYIGNLTNPMAIYNYVEFDLTNKLGVQSNNIKKEPFEYSNNTRVPKKVYATRKPKITYKCENCGKIKHKKNNCLKIKRIRKVNYTSKNYPEIESSYYEQENETIVLLEDEYENKDSFEDKKNIIEEEKSASDNDIFQSYFIIKKKPRFL